MAFGYKVLGQVAPANTSITTAYTVPVGKEAIVSNIAIANVTGTAALYEVYVQISGATAAASNALVLDASAAANSTILIQGGITLSAGDVISVQTATANAITFHVFGTEVTA
jgi:hypothetical protein